MIRIEVKAGRCKAVADSPQEWGTNIWLLLPKFEGRRQFKSNVLHFDHTGHNVAILEEQYNVAISDPEKEEREKAALASDEFYNRPARPDFKYKTKPYDHQARALRAWGPKNYFAFFMDMGTGKTKALIDKACQLWCEDEIDAVLIVGLKGVHSQWVDEQLPSHASDVCPIASYAWDKKKVPQEIFDSKKMCWLSINIDAVRTERGNHLCRDFIEAHRGRVLMVIDESQLIKNQSAVRTKHCCALGEMCDYRAIMTGTPIAKNLEDEWAQFKFLNEDIIGIRYQTTFRRKYCVMGGFENKQVVGHRNLEEFKALTAPYAPRS